MHFRNIAFSLVFVALSVVLHAQAVPSSMGSDDIGRVEVGANYNYFHGNAPPGQCGCFGLNGGSGNVVVNLTRRWSGVADVAVAFANNVDNTQQNITIVNYLFGPRYTRRNHSRFVPYGQILLGGAKENVNFDFVINRNSFGVLGGGGVTTKLGRGFGVTIAEVDYVYTRIPNAKNDTQNNIRIVTGVTYHFGAK